MKLWSKPLTMLVRIGILLAIAYFAAGATIQRAVSATLLPRSGFSISAIDPRVQYEPAAEPLSRAVAQALPKALEQLQKNQGFEPTGFTVRVYADAARFSRLGACPPGARGCAFRGDLSIGPRTSDEPDFLLPLLTHELSHVLLQQRMGMFKATRTPPWFGEGLAMLVSNGGGAETVTQAEAASEIAAGHHFTPALETSLLKPEGADAFGLPHRMFYRQSALFVQYLQSETPQQFQDLMRRLHVGGKFEPSFSKSYPQGLAPLWADFVQRQARRG